MYEDLKAIGEATDGATAAEDDFEMLPSGVGGCLWTTDTDFKAGAPAETHRDLDYYIDGDGFFAVADLSTGDVTLTRNGAFVKSELMRASGETDEDGQPIMERVYYLSDNEGRFVLSTTGGMIEITNERDEHPVGVFDYRVYDGMLHADSGRFIPIEKNGDLYLGTGTVRRGFLETSNVDLAQEFIKVIEAQRAYSYALKVVQTTDEIEQTINSLPG